MKLKLIKVEKEIIGVNNVIVNDLSVKNSHSYCVGNNNMIVHNCTTTKNASIGYPMASLIRETYEMKERYEGDTKKRGPAIIADGGMKDYSDVIKSLALGADFVQIGSLFNKSMESCGANHLYGIRINKTLAKFFFNKGFPVKKYFRGMSTKAAQKAMGKTVLKTSEGVIRYRKVEYHLSGWLENFEHYLRSAMSYTNSRTLEEFIGTDNIIRISKKSYDRFNK